MKDSLLARVTSQANVPVHPSVSAFAKRLALQAGAVAVLFYGSNLRTGSLEGVLDYYLLTPGPQKERIWPRVSYHEWTIEGQELRAKVATMSLEMFARAASGRTRDTTIWARFVQPSALIWSCDQNVREQVLAAISSAVQTSARLAVALGPVSGTEDAYWRALFQATYKAELRVEKPGREESILAANRAHFEGLLPLALSECGILYSTDGDRLVPQMETELRKKVLGWWKARQRLGKPVNIMRLLKASTTFEGASRYAAWKIERHTGIPVKVTPWREKHPVLSAPGVLWKVWRAKGRTGN
ncbi:MAG: hypothetical protein ACK5NN_11975 [Sphingomonadaceae bacterium]